MTTFKILSYSHFESSNVFVKHSHRTVQHNTRTCSSYGTVTHHLVIYLPAFPALAFKGVTPPHSSMPSTHPNNHSVLSPLPRTYFTRRYLCVQQEFWWRAKECHTWKANTDSLTLDCDNNDGYCQHASSLHLSLTLRPVLLLLAFPWELRASSTITRLLFGAQWLQVQLSFPSLLSLFCIWGRK